MSEVADKRPFRSLQIALLPERIWTGQQRQIGQLNFRADK